MSSRLLRIHQEVRIKDPPGREHLVSIREMERVALKERLKETSDHDGDEG